MMTPTAAVVTIWVRILGKYYRQQEEPLPVKKEVYISLIIEKNTKYF
jgi:hypothetical protein